MTLRLGVVGIAVTDMARSLSFYRAVGLEVPAEADGEQHVEVSLPGGLRLAFDTAEVMTSFDPGWTPATGTGHSLSLAFQCDSVAEVDAVYEALTAAGHPGHLPPWDAVWGQRYAVVHDPDGNTVDLYAAQPAAG